MLKRRFFCVALLGLSGALVCVTLRLYEYARADVLGGPLPAPRIPRDIILSNGCTGTCQKAIYLEAK